MFKAFFGVLALLAATFGLPHAPAATTSTPVEPVTKVLTIVKPVVTEPIALATSTRFGKAAPSDVPPPSSASVLPASVAPSNYITHEELAAQLQIATNALRSLIYQNESVQNSLIATGGITNEIAATNKIDQLSGTTLNNVIVSGVSGLTASDIPTNVVATNYFPLAGGTLTGALLNSSTASSSFLGALGIGTTSPSDLFAVNGAVYLADITSPPVTANRLYANSGNVYWAGNLLGGASTGNWTSDGTNVWRTGGNVGIGTSSPFTALSVNGSGFFGGNLTSTNIIATGTLSVLGSVSIASTTLTGNTLLTAATTTSLFASVFGLGSDHFTSLLGAGLANISNALSLDLTHANIWAALQQFNGDASTTQLSATSAYFGGTATSTFTRAGWLGIGTTSPSAALSVSGSIYSTSATSTFGDAGGNLGLGIGALSSFSSVSWDTAVGYHALAGDTTGTANTAFGYLAGASLTTTPSNTAMGAWALTSEVGGTLNTAVGREAEKLQVGDDANTAVGAEALLNNVNGSQNTAIGELAMTNFNPSVSSNTLTDNVALGYHALMGDIAGSSGKFNTALGFNSGSAVTSAASNVLVGVNTGDALTSGGGNTLLGSSAGSKLTTGQQNILIGTNVGITTLSTGNRNILLGSASNCDVPVDPTSDRFILCASSGSTPLLEGNLTAASLSLGIGTSTPYSRLEVWGPDSAATTSAFAVINNASTTVFSVYDNGNATYSGSIFQSSDQRLKTNILSLDASSSLAAIQQLNPVSYTRIDQGDQGQNLGFIAQQVANVFPALVSTTSATALTPDGTLTLNYVGLIAPMVKAVQVLAGEVVSLQATVSGFARSITSAVGNFGQVNAHTLCLSKSDGSQVCVTGDQLGAFLSGQSSQSVQISSPTVTIDISSSTSPTIRLVGSSPATVSVGDTYSDLGAVASDAWGHDLGCKMFVNGLLMNSISVDTSAPGTTTIDYVATDSAGNTATSTRAVVVTAATSTNQTASTTAQ